MDRICSICRILLPANLFKTATSRACIPCRSHANELVRARYCPHGKRSGFCLYCDGKYLCPHGVVKRTTGGCARCRKGLGVRQNILATTITVKKNPQLIGRPFAQ
jgi:hypothetical protein